ncbi:MAG: MFS transporter [Microthrixaceae bacterium]
MAATMDQQRRAMTPQQRTTLYMVMGVTLALDAGNGVVFGLIAEIQDAHGITTPQLGLISASLFGASLLGVLGLAHLADKGHARTMLLSGLALGAVSTAWFGLATHLWEFVASRALSGIAVSLFISAGRSLVTRIDPTRAGENLGRLAGAEITGFIIGPVVGAGLYAVGGLSLPFFVLSGIAAAAFVFFVVKFPHHDGPEDEVPRPATRQSYRQLTGLDLLGNRKVLAAALLALAVFLPVGAYDSMWSKYLHDLGASATFVGTSLTLYGVPLVLLSGRGGRLVDRLGPMTAGKRAMTCAIPVIVAYGVLDSYWIVALTAIVEAVIQAVASPSAQAAMAKACPPDRIGAGQGLAGAFGLSGGGLLASVAPAVYDRYGAGVLFTSVGVLVGAIAIAAFALDASANARLTPATQPA